MNIYVAIACLLASANADGSLGLGGLGGLVYAPGHASADYYSYPRYAFEYAVKDPHTGDNKAQWEKRDGDVVKGAYSLVEPDGSLRIVEYWADDKSGFNAVVKRIGPNLHPASVHAAPIYKAPIPVLSHGPIVSPISIGSVAKLGHLADAPLISGPVHGAISTQSLIKEPLPILKPVIQAPMPILPAAPIHHEPQLPILPSPIYKAAPILSGPIYKAGPIYSKPLAPLPYYKAPLPVYKEPLPLPIFKGIELGPIGQYEGINQGQFGPWDGVGNWEGLGRGPIGHVNSYNPIYFGGAGLGKGPIGPLPYGSSYDVIGKGPLGPSWEGPLEYSLIGGKH